ncbi:uroporphyrinogen decarboxylase family protein [Moorella naiadis]|uniref:uroporphyrinogen decarboxylase family protein n=1 Tax=Moorella naiadis (nom. illeg.) TaxID=3093670 RepID=UPI003D9C8602
MKEMSARERVRVALNHEEPDRVPLALGGSWYGITDPLYFAAVEELALGEPAAPFRPKRSHTVNYYDDRLLEALGVDIRHIWLGFSEMGAPPAGGGRDNWGIEWVESDGYRGARLHPLASATIEDLETYPWPGSDGLDLEAVRSRVKAIRASGDYAIAARAVNSYGLFELCCLLRGPEQFMVDLLTDPDFAHALVRKVGDVFYSLTEVYLDVAGKDLDLMELPGDDYADKRSLIIAPALFREFFAPEWRRLITLVKGYSPDIKVVFHSDGAITPLLGDLLDVGIDVFHPLEPLEVTDQAAVKKTYGDRLSFLGGVDIKEALQGEQQAISREIRERLGNLAPGGGYILAPANHIQRDVPAANLLFLFREAARLGRYPLAL